ncbi:TPA: hypothetical protein HA344_01345 [Candidatus Bathyarchaeota archaeon]|nr:hypothetical protein [Candidatus Bathyarchaeota archaeon]
MGGQEQEGVRPEGHFQGIFDVYKRYDYLVVAAPVYAFGFPATVKNVMDRFFVNLDPL